MNAQSLPSFSSFTALLNPQMEMEKMEDIVHSSFSPSYSIFIMFCDYFFCELGLHFFYILCVLYNFCCVLCAFAVVFLIISAVFLNSLTS